MVRNGGRPLTERILRTLFLSIPQARKLATLLLAGEW